MPVVVVSDWELKVVLFHLLFNCFEVLGRAAVDKFDVGLVEFWIVAPSHNQVDFMVGCVPVFEVIVLTIGQIQVLLANLLLKDVSNPPYHPFNL